MHHWIVEYDVFETRGKDHAAKRDQLNDELIGTMIHVPVVLVQGVEIRKPTWFKDEGVNLDQMMQQMGNRRNR